MNHHELPLAFILGMALMMLIAGVSATIHDLQSRDSFEREAVQHGAATWTVDEDGNRVFKWREKP